MSTPPPIASPPASSPPVPATNSTSPPPSIPSAQPPPSSSPSSSTPSSSPPPATRISPPPSSTPLAPAATPPTSSHSPPPTLNSTSPSTSGSSAASPPPSRSNNHPSTIPSAPGRSSPPPPIVSGSLPSGSNNLTTGVVVGIAVGAVSILLIVSILCICCAKKKRRRRDEETYYMPPPPGPKPKAHTYGGPPRCLQHNAPPPSDNVVTMMPKPSPPQPIVSRSQQSPMYVPPPPPPKPYTNSSAGSGSNYSGFSNIRPPPPLPHYSLGFSKSTFTYEELALATDAFSDANLLGQGGFGYVHKGVLPNGKEIAVKQLKAGSGQGEREFQAEVEIISRVHHRHLVSLVGYCMSGHQRMLVYEFVPNNNLEFHLHGKGQPTMDLPTRLKIALGSAKGLAYLHEDCHPKIIHRDIKASNILLDFRFEAKVADFGLAKITSDANTHVSTRVMGTFGYLAPEYASSGKLTDKSDVFSFGIMLLELITGRLPVDASHSMEDSLVDWARPLLNLALDDRNFYGLVDPRLRNDYDPNEMSCMVACAAACVQHSARRRPRMSQIVRALEGDMCFSDLNEGIRPRHSNLYSSYGSSDHDTSQYNEDLKKFRKMALGSKEYGASSEYSEPTSKYGLYPSGSSSGEAQTTREMEMRKFGKNNQDFRGSS